MKTEEITQKLYPLISKYLPDEINPEDITPEKDLLKDLKINSAYLIDIVIAIEETFNITIEDDVLPQMNTVGESIQIISRKVSEKG